MLVNVGSEERGSEEIFNRPRQVTTSVIFCALLVAGLLYAINVGYGGLEKQNAARIKDAAAEQQVQEQNLDTSATGNSRITKATERIANSLYRYASLPFEIASVLLLVAIVGSVMLARTLKQEAAVDDVAPDVLQKEAAREPELAKIQTDSIT
jgi:NADH-quinone oxidoreductase subunit J